MAATTAAPTSPSDSGGQLQDLVTPGDGPGATQVKTFGIAVISLWTLGMILFVLYSLFVFWPPDGPHLPAANAPASRPSPNIAPTDQVHADVEPISIKVRYFWCDVQLGPETRLFLLVLLAGGLGSLVHVIRSLYWYVGMRDLRRSWTLMYLLLPFSGATLALVFYCILRGGLFPQARADQNSPLGFVAIGCLIGMFSQQAVLKLKDVAETFFTKPAPGTDSKPQASLPSTPNPPVKPPAPSISLMPDKGKKEGGDQVTINGKGTTFTDKTKVDFGTIPVVPSQPVTSTQLTINTPAHAPGVVDVTVTTPGTTPDTLVAKFTYT